VAGEHPAYQASQANSDKMIGLWDFARGRELSPIPEPDGVNCLAISPDGRPLASGHWDNTVKLRDVDSGADGSGATNEAE
jgi:WD40 repeat protein